MPEPGPTVPGLSFAFSISAEIGTPVSGGPSPLGERLHIPILGGTVTGPRLKGDILPGGSDWPLIRPDGTSQIAASYTIRADDGTLILVRNRGLRVSSSPVLQRLRAKEPVQPWEYYFRTAPCFEAPKGPHDWLNDRLFVASARPGEAVVDLDVYVVD